MDSCVCFEVTSGISCCICVFFGHFTPQFHHAAFVATATWPSRNETPQVGQATPPQLRCVAGFVHEEWGIHLQTNSGYETKHSGDMHVYLYILYTVCIYIYIHIICGILYNIIDITQRSYRETY